MTKSRLFVRSHWSWAGIPALLIMWILLASRLPEYVLPQPWHVAAEALHWVRDGKLWPQLHASLVEETVGFGAAAAASLAIGMAAGISRPVREFVSPLVGLFMAIPPIAWAPLCLIVFGLGYLAIAVVIFIAAVFPMAVTIQEGVLGIVGGQVRAARTLGAGRLQLLRYVYLARVAALRHRGPAYRLLVRPGARLSLPR
jgi:taurine transport system permease protein